MIKFASLVARKFFYFWWLPQEAGVLYPPAWLTAYQVYALAIYGLAAVGAAAIVRGGNADARSLLLTIATIGMTLAIVHSLAYVEGRHRWGIEPLILLISARGAVAGFGQLRRATVGAASVASIASMK